MHDINCSLCTLVCSFSPVSTEGSQTLGISQNVVVIRSVSGGGLLPTTHFRQCPFRGVCGRKAVRHLSGYQTSDNLIFRMLPGIAAIGLGGFCF